MFVCVCQSAIPSFTRTHCLQKLAYSVRSSLAKQHREQLVRTDLLRQPCDLRAPPSTEQIFELVNDEHKRILLPLDETFRSDAYRTFGTFLCKHWHSCREFIDRHLGNAFVNGVLRYACVALVPKSQNPARFDLLQRSPKSIESSPKAPPRSQWRSTLAIPHGCSPRRLLCCS